MLLYSCTLVNEVYMIDRISSVNRQGQVPARKPQHFTGLNDWALKGVDWALKGVELCEKNPMVNVTVLDVATAIAPRTYIESETNAHAGFEAFRRESSGLIVNCLIPSFAVLGVAKALEKPIMGMFKDKGMASSWANQDTLETISKYYEKAEGIGRQKVENAVRNLLSDIEGVDGNIDKGGLKSFKDFDLEPSVKKITDAVYDPKNANNLQKMARKSLVEQIHISENIRLKGSTKFMSENLESVVRDMPTALRGLSGVAADKAGDFLARSKKLINAKSLGGLAIIIPLAISMQSINRWITGKTSGKKGAPIYKDFEDSKPKEKTAKDKAELLAQKFISVGSMVGVSLLSMMKLPTMKMFQFKGLFPSMDQARLISTATFASRMAVAEDKNELREATVRDIATFSSLYFLGDYAAKATASLIQAIKPDVKLLNTLKNSKEGANILQKTWNWVKHTSLKSSDEVATPLAKKMRSVCQLSNLAFSLLLLGVIIPITTRKHTDKARAEELKQAGMDKATIERYYPINFLSNHHPKAYKAFFTANKK